MSRNSRHHFIKLAADDKIGVQFLIAEKLILQSNSMLLKIKLYKLELLIIKYLIIEDYYMRLKL